MATSEDIARLRIEIGVPVDRPELIPDEAAGAYIDAVGSNGYYNRVLARACRYVSNSSATSLSHDSLVSQFTTMAEYYEVINAQFMAKSNLIRFDERQTAPTQSALEQHEGNPDAHHPASGVGGALSPGAVQPLHLNADTDAERLAFRELSLIHI